MVINPFNIDIEESTETTLKEIADMFTEKKSDIINRYIEKDISEEAFLNEIRSFMSTYKLDMGKAEDIRNILFGYGMLQPYVDDPDITDILVNDPQTVFIKKFGHKSKVPVSFGDQHELIKYCYKIVSMNNGIINRNEAQSVVTDRDRNMRIVVCIPPIAAKSPTISIRKPSASQTLDNLLAAGMFDEDAKDYLKKIVKERKTVIIAGKGGSGKTTLMGALINEIPLNERGLLIQETMEILPKHPDIITQLIRVSDNNEVKNYTLFDLTRAALLQSLDRIFIGEMKDKEAYDFFNAVYTGHRGSMATVHANSAGEVIDRLLYLMSRADAEMKEETLRKMLENSLDVIIFLKNYRIIQIKEMVH